MELVFLLYSQGLLILNTSTCTKIELLASMCSKLYHQCSLEPLVPVSNATRLYSLKNKHNIFWQEIRNENQEKELLASKCSWFYHQSSLETLAANFGTVIGRAQVLLSSNKPKILWQDIRSENQALSLKKKYWRLSVRISTINPAYKLFYRYRTRSGFTPLKPSPNSLAWN